MTNNTQTISQKIYRLLDNGERRDDIQLALVEEGYEPTEITELIAETVKIRHEKRRTVGLQLILAGAAICFSSFLITITSSFTQSSFPYVLFGLTGVGTVVIFAGFMKIF
jgi:hypothetical protein